jgi:large conductance mechanosensitive channel
MLRGFRDFIMRGNVVDLAIAVVIGTAFAEVVKSFVSAIITPILNAFPGASTSGWGFAIRGGKLHNSTFINISSIINALIVFVITAAIVYFLIVLPIQKVQALRARGLIAEPEVVPEEVLLLREIRDALAARPAGGATGSTPQNPS